MNTINLSWAEYIGIGMTIYSAVMADDGSLPADRAAQLILESLRPQLTLAITQLRESKKRKAPATIARKRRRK
jgi:hypothetical protein